MMTLLGHIGRFFIALGSFGFGWKVFLTLYQSDAFMAFIAAAIIGCFASERTLEFLEPIALREENTKV